MVEPFSLPSTLADEVWEALGLAPPTDLDGVADLYARWCASVPFDATAKALARAEGRPPPGDDPEAVCRLWLDTGIGATCWGHIAALSALLARCGVPTRAGLDRMWRDDLVDFHGFVVVLDGPPQALDPVHVSGRPLPLVAGARGDHPVYRAGFDADEPTAAVGARPGVPRWHWFANPLAPDRVVRYSLLSTVLDRADVRALCSVSATHTGVAARRLMHRRTLPGSMVASRPDEKGRLAVTTCTTRGTTVEVVDDLDRALDRLAYRPAAVPLLERAGLLEAGTGRWRWHP